ncbi:hypothetical protein HYALB_00013867 [Hymenoscyphus albidus]|uniref:Uncharacterized protein n=1 Tax=Hymenoscyphus albidus TaxID=595503 RepID=A0A9N9LZ12_9HELO|nr:hypothetical protein HYALB_00013867 [Hymenoscyphus albidus]
MAIISNSGIASVGAGVDLCSGSCPQSVAAQSFDIKILLLEYWFSTQLNLSFFFLALDDQQTSVMSFDATTLKANLDQESQYLDTQIQSSPTGRAPKFASAFGALLTSAILAILRHEESLKLLLPKQWTTTFAPLLPHTLHCESLRGAEMEGEIPAVDVLDGDSGDWDDSVGI